MKLKKVQEQLQAFYDEFIAKVADRATRLRGDQPDRTGPGVDRTAGEGERPC